MQSFILQEMWGILDLCVKFWKKRQSFENVSSWKKTVNNTEKIVSWTLLPLAISQKNKLTPLVEILVF